VVVEAFALSQLVSSATVIQREQKSSVLVDQKVPEL